MSSSALLLACSGTAGSDDLTVPDGAFSPGSGSTAGTGENASGDALAPNGASNGQVSNSQSDGADTGTDSQTTGTDPSNPTTAQGGLTGAADCTTPDTSPSYLRRLTRLEYQLSLKEIFQLPESPDVSAVPEDSSFKGFRSLTSSQSVTTSHLREYQELAGALTQDLIAAPQRFNAVAGCQISSAGCLQSFVSNLGRLAYRRSLTATEVDTLVSRAQTAALDAEDQFVFAAESILSAPDFVFRVEVGDGSDLATLTQEELVSRLSFTLQGRGPSLELMDRALSGELDTPEGLTGVAKELLTDERAQEYFDAFFKQWLGWESLRAPNTPPAGWSDDLLGSMSDETERFFNDFAWTPGTDFMDAFTANYSYMDAALAEFYGLPAPGAEGRVEFPAGHPKEGSGLLSQAALISMKSDADPVAHRGAWALASFLCIELELNSDLLASLGDELKGLGYYEIVAKRNQEGACAGCHSLIDPIGVGFAKFDASGHYDDSADLSLFGIQPALTGSEPPDFESLGELGAKLKARDDVTECLAERLFLYTGGRTPTAPDACAVQQASERFATDQNQFSSLLLGLVEAPAFRLRRSPEVSR